MTYNYGSQKPFCPQGHDKRVVGVDDKGHCELCKKWRTEFARKAQKVNKPNYSGYRRAMPGLKEVRERLGFKSSMSFATAGGFERRNLKRIEDGERMVGHSMQRKIENFVISLGGDVTRLYGKPEMVWRECPLQLEGHKPWYSVAIFDCPKCMKKREQKSQEEISAIIASENERYKNAWRKYSEKFVTVPLLEIDEVEHIEEEVSI